MLRGGAILRAREVFRCSRPKAGTPWENGIGIRNSSIKTSAFSEVPNTRILIGEPGFDNPSPPTGVPFPPSSLPARYPFSLRSRHRQRIKPTVDGRHSVSLIALINKGQSRRTETEVDARRGREKANDPTRFPAVSRGLKDHIRGDDVWRI